MATTRLREIRQRYRLSQVELSCRSRVSVRTISTAEAGRTIPRRRLQARLAQALRTPISELFPEGPPEEKPPARAQKVRFWPEG